MHFSIAIALTAFPFLVGAVPAQNSLRHVISIPLTNRSKLHKASGVIDAASLQANIHQTMTKFHHGFKAFEKNTGESHKLAPNKGKLDQRGIGVIPLTDCDSSAMWTGEITVGTPPKNFIVDFDTGSADLIIPGLNCPSCGKANIYDPTQSSTSENLWIPFEVSLLDGDSKGELFTDTVVAGGLQATCQTLGAASQYGNTFGSLNYEADGILGMAFTEVSQFNARPFFTSLVEQNQLQNPIFGVYLAPTDSELILGGSDYSRFYGDLTYVPVTVPGFWQVAFQQITVNGINIQLSNNNAIIDTGATQIIGDAADIANIYANIPGSAPLPGTGLWMIPCESDVAVTINFGGITFSIFPSTYVLAPTSAGTTACLGGFSTPKDGPLAFWVIGGVFLRNVYTEFDFGNRQIGFAQLAQMP